MHRVRHVRLVLPATADFSQVDERLTKLHAKLGACEVHALYFGPLTSTNFRLGPQRLLEQVLGDAPVVGETVEDVNAVFQILFGYWNTLVSEREAGRVRLAPAELPAEPTKRDLLDYAKRRHEELLWFVRGIDAGGDAPIEFGEEGQKVLEGIAKGGAYLKAYIDLLRRERSPSPDDLRKTRDLLLALVATAEGLVADLMAVTDRVRREALATFAAEAGRTTDDGARVAKPKKMTWNAWCPCGSGKKWKACCGRAERIQ